MSLGGMDSSTLGRSEEELDTVALTQSFWDIRNYRKVVRRVDDGYRLSSDLLKMIQERTETESKYIKGLQQWSRKWDEYVTKSSEYGTLESGWKSVFLSTSRVAEVHTDCQKKLEELSRNVSEWRADHYHKSIGGKLKESKKAEDGFQKAQKPWERNFDRTSKAKKAYHQLAKELESADNALTNAENNPVEFTQEQMSKLRERKEKAEKEMERSQRRYKELLDDLFHHKRHYVEDMEREFDKCQAFEKMRIEFFKDTLLKFRECVDPNKQNQVSCIYQVCSHTLNQINSEEDLQWYSLHYGTSMPYIWPEYEEYIPEKIDKTPVFHYVPEPTSNSSSSSVTESSSRSESSVVYPENHIYDTADVWQPTSPGKKDGIKEKGGGGGGTCKDQTISPSISSSSTGGGEEKEESSNSEQKRDLLKALYDYQGDDDDDLSFRAGDIVSIVEYCDGGWAKAFLGEQYGYIPSAYFEPIKAETVEHH